jgi:hypothetical protein
MPPFSGFRGGRPGEEEQVRLHQLAAVAQVTLEGAALPASRRELLDYARAQQPSSEVLEALAGLPDQRFERLDDVGEAIARTQPAFAPPPAEPRPESGDQPGADAYLDSAAAPGAVRGAPAVLQYEEQLVREPAPPGEGTPETGSTAPKP